MFTSIITKKYTKIINKIITYEISLIIVNYFRIYSKKILFNIINQT